VTNYTQRIPIANLRYANRSDEPARFIRSDHGEHSLNPEPQGSPHRWRAASLTQTTHASPVGSARSLTTGVAGAYAALLFHPRQEVWDIKRQFIQQKFPDSRCVARAPSLLRGRGVWVEGVRWRSLLSNQRGVLRLAATASRCIFAPSIFPRTVRSRFPNQHMMIRDAWWHDDDDVTVPFANPWSLPDARASHTGLTVWMDGCEQRSGARTRTAPRQSHRPRSANPPRTCDG
jgi:hypothetical protein